MALFGKNNKGHDSELLRIAEKERALQQAIQQKKREQEEIEYKKQLKKIYTSASGSLSGYGTVGTPSQSGATISSMASGTGGGGGHIGIIGNYVNPSYSSDEAYYLSKKIRSLEERINHLEQEIYRLQSIGAPRNVSDWQLGYDKGTEDGAKAAKNK